MTALGFKRRFVAPTLAGTKGGSIRKHRKDGRLPAIGTELQLYTAMRTKQCALIMRTPCIGVLPIAIHFKGITRIVAGRQTWRSARALDHFACFDGFGDFADMREFWRETHGRANFTGNWIKWLQPDVPVVMGATVKPSEAQAA